MEARAILTPVVDDSPYKSESFMDRKIKKANTMQDQVFCDNCGDEVVEDEQCWFSNLPVNSASANAGESAVLCLRCARLAEAHDEQGLLRVAGIL